jgi:hypothetical protein
MGSKPHERPAPPPGPAALFVSSGLSAAWNFSKSAKRRRTCVVPLHSGGPRSVVTSITNRVDPRSASALPDIAPCGSCHSAEVTMQDSTSPYVRSKLRDTSSDASNVTDVALPMWGVTPGKITVPQPADGCTCWYRPHCDYRKASDVKNSRVVRSLEQLWAT